MLPLYSKNWSDRTVAGGIVAAYSLMQFIFSPMWGRLSDRIGRRPVLLVSTRRVCRMVLDTPAWSNRFYCFLFPG